MGHRVCVQSAAALLLFAGGSGITPLLSILKEALTLGTGDVVLFYANSDERSVLGLSGAFLAPVLASGSAQMPLPLFLYFALLNASTPHLS